MTPEDHENRAQKARPPVMNVQIILGQREREGGGGRGGGGRRIPRAEGASEPRRVVNSMEVTYFKVVNSMEVTYFN